MGSLIEWQRLSGRRDPRRLIREFRLVPETLKLEMNESILLNPAPFIENLIRAMRELRVRMTLDKDVVAERIETTLQERLVRDLDCPLCPGL